MQAHERILMWECFCHLQTLSGHTSPVEYVKFNSGEDLVIAGSQSGTLKIWDLEAAKSKFKYKLATHSS